VRYKDEALTGIFTLYISIAYISNFKYH